MTDTNTTDTDNELGHRRRVLALGTEIGDLLRDIVDRAKEYHELGVPAREWLSVVAGNLPDKAARLIAWGTDYMAPAIDIGLGMLAGQSTDKAAEDAFKAGVHAARCKPTEEQIDVGELSLVLAREHAEWMTAPVQSSVDNDDNERLYAGLPNLAKCFIALDDAAISHNEHAHTIRMRQVIGRLFAAAPKLEGADGKVDETQAPALDVHILLRSGAPIQFSGILSTTPEGTLRLMTPTKNGDGKPCMIEQFFDYADVTSVAVVRDVKVAEGSRIITS